jgi:DNA (cytosine-5)-methyltransferase 1
MALTFGSLFAGVGGFDMGFEQAGWDCKFQVEWDKNCQQILNKHWPDVPKWLDVSDVNGAEIPPVDCIIFGSPCQDLSVAGKRAGLKGERSGLFHEAVRIIKEMRDATNGTYPRWTIWENVAGALSSNNGRDFGTVINEMAKAGAHLQEYALLDAQHFGIPQRRRRVFLVSCFDPATADKCPDPLLPVTESVRGDTKKGKQKRQSASRTLTEGVGAGSGIVNAICGETYHHGGITNQDLGSGHMVVEDAEWWNGGQIADSLTTTSNEQRMPDKQRLQAVIVGSLAARDYKGVGNQYVAENKCVVEPVLTQNPSDWSLVPVGVEWFVSAGVPWEEQPSSVTYPIQDGREIEKHQNGFGVASDGDPSYTLDQTGAQAVAYSVREDAKANTFSATELDHANALSALRPSPQSHHAQMFIAQSMAVRRLTPLECERLMGWPDDHTRYKADGTEQADSHRYRQCGNGVASPVARWVAEQIAKVEHGEG